MNDYFQELKQHVDAGADKETLSKLKTKLAKKYKLLKIPTDTELFLKGINIVSKPVRTISGVAPLALMSAPFGCPHGKCVYCPGGPGAPFGDVPQSYTGKEQ